VSGEGPARSPHRAWIEIDHAAVSHNLAVIRELAGAGKQVIAVVKANAYGHGDVEVSRTLLAAGAERLGVATLGEGLRLRAAGITAPILVLWGLGEPEADQGPGLRLGDGGDVDVVEIQERRIVPKRKGDQRRRARGGQVEDEVLVVERRRVQQAAHL